MLARRIIGCLDVAAGQVVKGTQFKDHKVVGDIVELATRYAAEGVDELVLYDIKASVTKTSVDTGWISRLAVQLDIPFCVAGGVTSIALAGKVLESGADKVSINSPALARPELISELAETFGSQSVVVGVDSWTDIQTGQLNVKQNTGSTKTISDSGRETLDWIKEAQERGAGEIVLNAMNSDGVKNGYDLDQLTKVRAICDVPLIASGGAGTPEHFLDAFTIADVDGALAASVFHSAQIEIGDLKQYLNNNGVTVRL